MKVNILYQFNEKYVPYAGVSMTSLFENNKGIDEIDVYILEENITPESKTKIKEMAQKYKREVIFIDTEDLVDYLKELEIPNYRNSYATNLKLFADCKIPDSVERILYIDSDTIVNASIIDLYQTTMNDNPLAMALDSLGRNHALQIGLTRKDSYYNAGVILFDLTIWKKQRCTEKIVSHVKNVRAHYMAPDQDLLNIVFNNKITTLDIKYNFQPIMKISSYKQHKFYFAQKNYYTKDEVENATNNPNIIHFFRFLGEFPWHKNTQHPFVKYFDSYLEISEWNGYKKKESEQSSVLFNIERCLYKVLPKCIFIIIFKVNYEAFIWRAHRNSLKKQNSKLM